MFQEALEAVVKEAVIKYRQLMTVSNRFIIGFYQQKKLTVFRGIFSMFVKASHSAFNGVTRMDRLFSKRSSVLFYEVIRFANPAVLNLFGLVSH